METKECKISSYMQTQSDYEPETTGHLKFVKTKENDPYTSIYHCSICGGDVEVDDLELSHGKYVMEFGIVPCKV